MTKHPLTMDIIFNEFWDIEPPLRKYRDGTNFSYEFFEEGCQMSYDKGREEGHAEMLKAISLWTKKHAWSYMEECRYTDDHEFNASKFVADLRKAMHPMEDN